MRGNGLGVYGGLDNPDAVDGAVLAIDPGREKCGIAIVSRSGRVFFRGIVPTSELSRHLRQLTTLYGFDAVVLGDRTGSKILKDDLKVALPGKGLFLVDEHGSTLEGRKRYLLDNPPHGLGRLMPFSLRTPERPYDDYVAIVLAERFFRNLDSESDVGNPDV